MSKKISANNRLNLSFALVIVFLLVFATNRIDKQHFDTVQNSLTSVYQDRVIAQNYIYEMNNIIHKKHRQLFDSGFVNNHDNLSKEFTRYINLFSETKLTPKESKTFESLKANFEVLQANESKKNHDLDENINAIQIDLNSLSAIQLSETKNLMGIAQKSLDNNNLMSKLEIVFLILIGFIVQFAVFYRVKQSKPVNENLS